MRTFVKNQHGFVVFVSMIMVLISLGYTVGYLHFVMGERILFSQRFAEARARYNAFTGISEEINALLRSPNFNTSADTTLDDRDIDEMLGGFRDVKGMMKENLVAHRSMRHGRATGWSSYNSFSNEAIEVDYTMEVNYRARGFEEFMYLTNEESPSGPWPGTTVTFGSGEILEGLVYSNDDITMSNFGCPEFVNYETDDDFEMSQVYTAGVFNYGGCNENSSTLFQGVHKDSMPRIAWPPYEGQDLVKSKADYFYSGNSLINTFDMEHHDVHIMTRLVFDGASVFVTQWPYRIPPFRAPENAGEVAAFEEELKMYYPLYYRDNFAGGSPNVYFGEQDFQHYDFHPPTDPADYITNDVIMASEAVIWIDGGQVQVQGTIQGRYTVATSSPQPYKMAYDSTRINELNCNIWIMDDLVYQDSEMSGYVIPGSPNRLGLLSGGNIIVANTTPNGRRNGGALGNIKINAAMIAMNESFVIQYWQNSTTQYNFLDGISIKGDGRSVSAFRPATGTTDIRGTVMIFGSVVQEKRGYLKRNAPAPGTGGYNISPGIGYEKDYHYDRNLRTFPPPEWPETKNSDGSSSLELSGIGEYLDG